MSLQARVADIDKVERILVFWDLETTGLPVTSGITQIAAVACIYDRKNDELVPLSRFNQYSRPSCPISAAAAKITGITPEVLDAERAVPEAEAVKRFIRWSTQIRAIFSRGVIAVAHNGDRYDLPVLFNALNRACPNGELTAIPFESCIDTLPAARNAVSLRRCKSKKLSSLYEHVATEEDKASAPSGGAHRADFDVDMLRVVYARCFVRKTEFLTRSWRSLAKSFNATSAIQLELHPLDNNTPK